MRVHAPTRPGTNMHAFTRKHAHTDKYVILIAFALQQWFRERASVLRYTCVARLVKHVLCARKKDDDASRTFISVLCLATGAILNFFLRC